MTDVSSLPPQTNPFDSWPVTLPLAVDQYRVLVERGDFTDVPGKVELINGRIVQMNPQGPRHADPMDYLAEWSIKQSGERFTIRIEKPIEIPNFHSSPEPDVAWVDRFRYVDQHPRSHQIHLLIEVSQSSLEYDSTEKMELYANAGIPEYWLIDLNTQTLIVHRDPCPKSYGSRQVLSVDKVVSPACLPKARLAIAELFVSQDR